jgi:hypothetical protein
MFRERAHETVVNVVKLNLNRIKANQKTKSNVTYSKQCSQVRISKAERNVGHVKPFRCVFAAGRFRCDRVGGDRGATIGRGVRGDIGRTVVDV